MMLGVDETPEISRSRERTRKSETRGETCRAIGGFQERARVIPGSWRRGSAVGGGGA